MSCLSLEMVSAGRRRRTSSGRARSWTRLLIAFGLTPICCESDEQAVVGVMLGHVDPSARPPLGMIMKRLLEKLSLAIEATGAKKPSTQKLRDWETYEHWRIRKAGET